MTSINDILFKYLELSNRESWEVDEIKRNALPYKDSFDRMDCTFKTILYVNGKDFDGILGDTFQDALENADILKSSSFEIAYELKYGFKVESAFIDIQIGLSQVDSIGNRYFMTRLAHVGGSTIEIIK